MYSMFSENFHPIAATLSSPITHRPRKSLKSPEFELSDGSTSMLRDPLKETNGTEVSC